MAIFGIYVRFLGCIHDVLRMVVSNNIRGDDIDAANCSLRRRCWTICLETSVLMMVGGNSPVAHGVGCVDDQGYVPLYNPYIIWIL